MNQILLTFWMDIFDDMFGGPESRPKNVAVGYTKNAGAGVYSVM
jgi:hypothetical protein